MYVSRHYPPLLPQSAEAILLAEWHYTSTSCTQAHIPSYLPLKLETFCTLKDDLLQQNVK